MGYIFSTSRQNYTSRKLDGKWLSRNHKSSIYDGAEMPYSVFFNGDYAIHGTRQVSKLGEPASAGCIRLHPKNAKIFFELARLYGVENTLVKIVN